MLGPISFEIAAIVEDSSLNKGKRRRVSELSFSNANEDLIFLSF